MIDGDGSRMPLKIRFSQIKERYGYTIHYTVLNANNICNIYGPDSGADVGWGDNEISTRKRLTKATRIITKRNKQDNFFNNLEKSILEKGIENPLMLYAGSLFKFNLNNFPEHMRNDKSKILICVHGGSRLYYAQKYNMDVSCIVCSWCTRFKKEKVIRSEADLLNCYKTPPTFTIMNYGIRILQLKHIHMESK